MTGTGIAVRLALAREGDANVATGLPVLDHLVAQFAQSGRFKLALEAAPGSAEEAVAAAGRALGGALGERVRAPSAAGRGWALVPADEALAAAALETDDEPRLVSNVDLTGERVGGLENDVASRFLREVADAAGVNLHVRLLEGTEPQHVLAAIFKAVGAAFGQAGRPVPTSPEEE
jgi:imidazoleglycerol phosphate dehydratase HisB